MKLEAVKLICLGILVLVLGAPALAQNTKGDRPAPPPRETRFKTPKKSKPIRQPSRRVRRGDDKPNRVMIPPPREPSRRSDRPGKPVGPQFSRSKPKSTERVWKGDVSGRRIQPRQSAARAKNVYPQPGTMNYSSQNLRRSIRQNQNPNVKRVRKMQRDESYRPRAGKPIRPTFHKSKPTHRERAWRGDITGRRIRTTSSDRVRPAAGQSAANIGGSRRRQPNRQGVISPRVSGRAKNVFSRRPYNIASRSQARSNRFQSRIASSQARNRRRTSGMFNEYNARRKPGQRSRKIVPRSASASYLSRRSINTWAHFRRPKRESEKAFTRDIAGKRLRTKNFESQRPGLLNSTLKYQRRATGERPYGGRGPGTFSRIRSDKAWRGDIAHRAVRGGFRSKKGEPKAGIPIFGKGPGRMDRRAGRFQGNLPAGRRGMGEQGVGYTGNLRLRKSAKGGGSVTRGWNNNGQPVQGRRPGMGADGAEYTGNIRGRRGFNDQGEEYSGNVRFRRSAKGGGSVTRGWNNKGQPVQGRRPGMGADGADYTGNLRGRRGFNDQGEEYTGNIRFRRSAKGGGSVTRGWNNKGQPVQGRRPGMGADGADYTGNIRGRRGFNDQGEEYTGNIRFRRPAKGGGSVTRGWNNKGQPVQGRRPGMGADGVEYTGNIKGRRGFNDQGEEYTGNIRFKKPAKGGGTVTRGWNNKGQPVQGRRPGMGADGVEYTGNIKGRRGFNDQGEEYTGNIRFKKPAKGGGTVTRGWNNKGQPIQGRMPGMGAEGAAYTGNIKAGRRGFNDQGEEYTGNIKARRPQKGGGSVSGNLWNNNEKPIRPRIYEDHLKVSRYAGNVKARRPEKGGGSVSGVLWNNNETPIKGREHDHRAGGFSGNLRLARNTYKRNPYSAEGSIPVRKATPATFKAGEHTKGVRKTWDYVRNPSSADEAPYKREPGRAFGRSADFQGNIRIRKFDLFGKSNLHPDAQFVRTNKNNVAEEKDVMTNFKLWWARLFRKAETQPDHLKDNSRDRKPRYDKGEAGLWYD